MGTWAGNMKIFPSGCLTLCIYNFVYNLTKKKLNFIKVARKRLIFTVFIYSKICSGENDDFRWTWRFDEQQNYGKLPISTKWSKRYSHLMKQQASIKFTARSVIRQILIFG